MEGKGVKERAKEKARGKVKERARGKVKE